jgi:hypothetical protein
MISQNALVEEGCMPISAMSSSLLFMMIHRMPVPGRCAILTPCKLAAVVIQNALVEGRVCYPCAATQTAADNVIWKRAILRCHASSLLS